MKQKIKLFTVALTTCLFTVGFAQGNWEDNSGSPSTIKTTTPDPVGIGTSTPDGRTEITYCPTPTPTNGLVVTLDDCTNGAVGLDPSLNWGSGAIGTLDPNPGTGGGPEIILQSSGIPWVFSNSVLPTITIQNLLTTHSSNPTPSMPLIWARTKNFDIVSGQKKYSTKLMVMPNGFTGINTATPRTNLDVVATSGWGTPVAIFGTQAQSNSYTAGNGANASFTRHISVVPNCRQNSFNTMTEAGDVGLFFTDGFGKDLSNVDNGSNSGAGLVIAPWASGVNANSVGGLRIDPLGNLSVHGFTRTTEVKINPKWWSDYVFEKDYKLLSLDSVEQHIKTNKHLPDVPSEAEVLENGINVGEMQAIQLQKIEEITLYLIKMNKELQALKQENEELKKAINQ